ncbi:hypothetical protein E1301_Tti023631 [Triplophysa tibetana]|uniref:Uncharacterized protein n=1 Tax=Triplophysa tibetana TaxID=1572043 RepID=A0A5A9PR88_9TELE|nr:hypothetical protein E1301_Tti023631 [Triplophysa tibetana]
MAKSCDVRMSGLESFVQFVENGDGRDAEAAVNTRIKSKDRFLTPAQEAELHINFGRDKNSVFSQYINETKVCKHNCTTTKQLSSFEKCVTCEGPFSPLKWVGVKCKVLFHQLMQMLSESEVDELSSGDEYVPGSASDMETDSDQENAGMFVRQELWRHMKRCQSKPAMSDESAGGRHRVLTIAAVAKSAFSGQVDDGLMKNFDSYMFVLYLFNYFLTKAIFLCRINRSGGSPGPRLFVISTHRSSSIHYISRRDECRRSLQIK